MTGRPRARHAASRDLVALAACSISLFVLAAASGLLDAMEEWERRSDLSRYHVEELAILLVMLGIAASILLFRRYRDTDGQAPRETDACGDAGPAGIRPAPQYEELESLFHRVEAAKKEWERSLDSVRDMVIVSGLDGTIHRCNRAFKEFVGLPYDDILRENMASLLSRFGIEMKGLDLAALNARFHIDGKWFGVRSDPYPDAETGEINKAVIILHDVTANRASGKVQFVWGLGGNPRAEGGQPNP